VLHVTNGASAAARIRAAGHRGAVLTWDDALHEGPLAAGPESRALRARFLAEHGWGDVAALERDLERRDARLARAAAEDEPIVLWFEHDLYDQLQLLQVLTALDGAPAELIQATVFLGASGTDLAPLWTARAPVTAAQTALARAAWAAVCAGDLGDVPGDTSSLPCLGEALARLRAERGPRPRTEAQLLAALAGGPRDAAALFAANQAAEEAPFLGDAWCFARLHALAEQGLVAPVDGELPLPPPRGDHGRFAALRLALTG